MTKFEDLNEGDRLALCDIAWFIKGFRLGNPESGLDQDHEDTLKRVINAVGEKVRADQKRTNGVSKPGIDYVQS